MIQNSPNTKNMEFVTCNGTVSLHIYLTIWEMLWNCRKLSKIQVWRRLGQVSVKILFPQTILSEIFGHSYRNTVKLDNTSGM